MTKLTEEEKKSLRRFNQKFQVFLLIVFGIIFNFLGTTTNSRIEWFRNNGVQATAEVFDAYTKNRQVSYVVQFETDQGHYFTEIQADLMVGQTVEILYNPYNPTDVIVANNTKTGGLFYVGGIIFWLFAAVGILQLGYNPPTK